jgi:hypothetical protein
MGDSRVAYRVLAGNIRERDRLEDLGLDGKIILKCIFNNWDEKTCTGLFWLRIGTRGGHL